MYYNGSRVFLISFLVSLITSLVVCVLFLYVLPISKGGEVVIPDLTGSTPEQARVIAENRGLLLVVGGEEESEKFAENQICRQNPLPGSVVRSKSSITVFISKGASNVIVPELKGLGLSEATIKLNDLGLRIGDIKTEENSTIEKDKIISTLPVAGSRVKRGDAITIVLSGGAEMIEVPRLIGKALTTAKRIIEEKGFVVGSVSYEVSTEFDVGIVMAQNPKPGTKARKGSKIDLIVATVLDQ
jgi:serine/threonine-protein kinase|uniref:PASTA domain-containing protein n=1 Tax=candidate division WOR-3 bacterium TaxID=2052148 RepID=A0A7V3RHH7_UNCW3